ncbi:hypothetical protein PR003_g23612 [Phytophthora rubi]|uniref:Uncharacterized protein n=1 Tax=Phytophthora rubi TaxID=129364 RepID=A0A6A4CY80_9STRA|nr:hypothetical protein PR002_g25508 [Phytophthora rubi]KAE8987177.1 hypothetical protein PR001_g22402 [Phytophthora rubi]KAE9297015.1 hypothetical protein PR003_g23612 [Phytophthora rubi]
MDEANTLSEVLTLLDAIDSADSDSSPVASVVESHTSHDETSDLCWATMQTQLSPPKVKKDRRRKEGPVRYTTSLQRRKKAELKSLREEAQKLNAQLENLMLSRSSHNGMGHNAKGHLSVWRSLAMVESEGRERAERTNQTLKAIMSNQLQVLADFRKVVGRSNVLEGMDFVSQHSRPVPDRPLFRMDFSDAILSDLSNSLGRLRLEVDRVFPALEDNLSIACSSQARGNCVETSSITPMACTVQMAGKLLWHHITTKKNMDAQKSFRFARTRNSNSFERNCMASLPNGNGTLLHLDGVNIVRKYEEANQIILVGTTTWFLPTGGLQFEDHHWTIISPSPTDPQHASVVRSCYQLQVKQVDTTSVRPVDFVRVGNLVLDSIGKKLRNVLQLQQNVLLDNADPVVNAMEATV